MTENLERRATNGARELLRRGRRLLTEALRQRGPDASVGFPDCAYYLPTILGITGQPVSKTRELQGILEQAAAFLDAGAGSPGPGGSREQPPYAGLAAALAAEAILALEASQEPGTAASIGHDGSPGGWIDDSKMRAWGVGILEGRIPGFALIVGRASSNWAGAQIIEELSQRNITCFAVSGEGRDGIGDGMSRSPQDAALSKNLRVMEGDSTAAVHVLGLLARVAMRFGDIKPGANRELLAYTRGQLPGFVLALEDVDEAGWSIAAGAMNFGLPVIDSAGRVHEAAWQGIFCRRFDEAAGTNDQERAVRLVKACIDVSRMRVSDPAVELPVEYGPGYKDEIVPDSELYVEFGAGGRPAFEHVEIGASARIENGRVRLSGPDLDEIPESAGRELGIFMRVAGPRMKPGCEQVLEGRMREYLGAVHGVQISGRGDASRVRISHRAARRGLDLKSLGGIVHRRVHAEFGSGAEKVEVEVITDPRAYAERWKRVRAAHAARERERARLTDAGVNEFYACLRCRAVEPMHICLISPEREGPCGEHDWISCRAEAAMGAYGMVEAVRRGRAIDRKRGYWEGINAYVHQRSGGRLSQVAMHSLLEYPMTACSSLECVAMVIPETNGVMIVSREDGSRTPAGMPFEALAEMAGGGGQTPGVMGIAKSYLTSPHFIAGDGGFKRVVWLSTDLKHGMSDRLAEVCRRLGDPDLIDKIADGASATTVPELLGWLESHQHPVLTLEPLDKLAKRS